MRKNHNLSMVPSLASLKETITFSKESELQKKKADFKPNIN